MEDLGKGLAGLGIAGFLLALLVLPTSVASGAFGTDEVVNLALQQRQLLVAAASLTLFLAGIVLIAGGAIVSAVASGARQRGVEGIVDADEAATMERLGIEREGHEYKVNGFIYRTFPQAVAAAERDGPPAHAETSA